jgi:hypothetical protein
MTTPKQHHPLAALPTSLKPVRFFTMLRQLTISAIRSSSRSSVVSSSRTFSYTAIRMGEGDTGGVRSGGAVARYAKQTTHKQAWGSGLLTYVCHYSDAFSKREEAAENMYMREKEMEK